MRREFPILEHDPDRAAVVEPSAVVPRGQLPRACIVSFFADAVDRFVATCGARLAYRFPTIAGYYPVYEFTYRGLPLALLQSGVGGPLAAALLEQAIAMGSTFFVACGGAGVLDEAIPPGHLILPVGAVRDDGTSYHYLPPSREAIPSPRAVRAIEAALDQRDVPVVKGKTWSTDAIFRETRSKVDLRRSEGCIAVEMEAAALFSVATFRGVDLGSILYASDAVAKDWDRRRTEDRTPLREQLIRLSAEACRLGASSRL